MNDSNVFQAGIIGAGIAGLSTAIALRRAGWQCEVFERSSFKYEVGAAIAISPIATRCLDSWGFDFTKARAIEGQQLRIMLAENLHEVFKDEFPGLEQQFGHKCWTLHRADLHKGLLDLAVEENEGQGSPAIVRLGCQVQSVDFSKGMVSLADGTSFKKDLIIIADGAHVSIIAETSLVLLITN
jgi:salicylate hydroxylase